MRHIAFFCSCLILLSLPIPATELLRENLLAEEWSRRYGEQVVWLEASGNRFLALQGKIPQEQKLGGIILLQGPENSLESMNFLFSLHARLQEKHWDSLLLQSPVTEGAADPQAILALLPEMQSRFQAAIAHLKEAKSLPILLLGQGTGGLAILGLLSEKPDTDVAGATLVQLMEGEKAEQLAQEGLAKIHLPLLDLSPTDSHPNQENAEKRRLMASAGNPGYQQIRPEGGFGEDQQQLLMQRIHAWLLRHVRELALTPTPTQAP
jgi:hypothetical protein